MKSIKLKTNWLLISILVFHISSSEASLDDVDDEVRILAVGVRGQSRFIAADLLSGRRGGGQEDGEIVKTPVITDEAGRTMLVTGPNLCEEDAERQTFTTALFHSTPGPHAVLMVLNLEDQQSGQCDVKKRAQEMLGAEVLQYCIVLLLQNHQEPFTGASGEMIDACGGRFHIIRDSEPKPKAFIAEINKLVWLNGHRFHSVPRREETSQDVHEENKLLAIIYEYVVGAVAITVWTYLLSFPTHYVYPHRRIIDFHFNVFEHVTLMLCLRYFLNPNVAIPVNLVLITASTNVPAAIKRITHLGTRTARFVLLMGLTLNHQRQDVVRRARGMLRSSRGHIWAFLLTTDKNISQSPVFMVKLYLFCFVGMILSVGFVRFILLPPLDERLTIFLLILGFITACVPSMRDILQNAFCLVVVIVVFPCACVLIGSVFLMLGSAMSFIKVIIETLFSSFLFHLVLLICSLIIVYQWLTGSE